MKNPLAHIWENIRDIYAYRHEPERANALARTYWRALLVVVVLALTCSVLWGMLTLLAVRGDSSGEMSVLPHGSAGAAGLNRAQLQAVLDAFAVRRAHYESLKTNPPQVADPSK